jgi:hypothetical protein
MKTKRGTYFYIELAGMFYAGTRPIMISTKVYEPRELTESEKAIPRYRRTKIRGYPYHSWGFNGGKLGKPTKEVLKDVPSNKYEDYWVEDKAKAKKFRLKAKADTKACEFSQGNVKATVLFHEGS